VLSWEDYEVYIFLFLTAVQYYRCSNYSIGNYHKQAGVYSSTMLGHRSTVSEQKRIQYNSFNLVPMGPDKCQIIKHSRLPNNTYTGCVLLGISPASDCVLSTFRNPLSGTSSKGGCGI
jgi:hypothetical protein